MAVDDAPFRRVAVLGPGLIGGSVLLALRRYDPEVELVAWARRSESVADLQAHAGLVDLATDDLSEALEGVDCIILAMPIGYMASVVERFDPLPLTGDGRPVLVTDVGSVKASVVRNLSPLVREKGGEFLGSHPMAGSEKKGLEHAEAALFQGAPVILTPEGEDSAELPRLREFWQRLGAVVSVLAPNRHDDLVAGISHLPHLLAAALVRSVLSHEPKSAALSGGGFRDTTRIAGGPEDMWTEILVENAEAVSAQLARMLVELRLWQVALDDLDRPRLLRLLSEARQLRGTLLGPDPKGRVETF